MKNDTINIVTIDDKVKKLLECKNVLMYGPHKSGKTLGSIKYSLREISSRKSLYFTSASKDDLIAKAVLIKPDLNSVINKNFFIYQAPILNLNNGKKVDDNTYTMIILGILNIIEKQKPDRIVFDELTQYLAFSDLNSLKMVFLKLLRYLEDNNISSLFTVAEPASPRAAAIVNVLEKEFSFYLNLSQNPILNNN